MHSQLKFYRGRSYLTSLLIFEESMTKEHIFFIVINLHSSFVNLNMSQRQRGPKTHYRVKRPMSHALDESPPANGGKSNFLFKEIDTLSHSRSSADYKLPARVALMPETWKKVMT